MEKLGKERVNKLWKEIMKGQQEKTVEEDSPREDYAKQKVEVEMVAMDTA